MHENLYLCPGNQIYENVFYNTPGINKIRYSGGNIRRSGYFDVHGNLKVRAMCVCFLALSRDK